jgi:ankyrin repeat protein/Flp pilus assembly protein TadD
MFRTVTRGSTPVGDPQKEVLQGLDFWRAKDYLKAIKCYERAIALDAKRADAWSNKAICHQALGDIPEAIECCQQSLEIDPQFGMAWNNLGNLLAHQKQTEQAIAAYKKAVEAPLAMDDHYRVRALTALGRLERMAKQFSAALEALRRANQIDPKYTEARVELAFTLIESGASFQELRPAIDSIHDDGYYGFWFEDDDGKTSIAVLKNKQPIGSLMIIETKGPWKELVAAACRSDTAALGALLEGKADVDAKTINGTTALMKASAAGFRASVEMLLAKGAQVNAREECDGETALIRAARNGHAEIVKLLLASGADAHARMNSGSTALLWATEKGHSEVVKLLLAARSDANARTGGGATSLILASERNHHEIVRALLGNGAEVNATQPGGFSSLLFASQNGCFEAVQLLLGHGAEVEARDETHGATALLLAAQNGHSRVVKVLLERGAQINTKRKDGHTALSVASSKGHREVAALLMQAGAN